MDAQRALLDQLMGADRNLAEGEEMQEVDWSHRQYCSFYNSGLCPYLAFTGTKADIGKCTLKHSDKAREAFRRAPRYKQRPVDQELVAFLGRIISDLERHIRRGLERIDIIANAPPDKEREETLVEIKERIKTLYEEMEALGKDGKVEKSATMLVEVKRLEKRRDRIEEATKSREDHRLDVCDMCGGFMVIDDTNEERVSSHATGKQHVGYIKVRDALKDLQRRLDADTFEDRYGPDGMVPSRRDRDRDRSSRDRSSRDRRSRSRSSRSSRHRSHRDRDYDRHRSATGSSRSSRHRSSRHDDDHDDGRRHRHTSSSRSHRSSRDRHRSSRSSRHRSRSRSRSRSPRSRRDRDGRSSRHSSSRHRSSRSSRHRRDEGSDDSEEESSDDDSSDGDDDESDGENENENTRVGKNSRSGHRDGDGDRVEKEKDSGDDAAAMEDE